MSRQSLPEESIEIHSVLEVKSIRYLIGSDMFQIKFKFYAASLVDLVLYANGSEPCPFQIGDFYLTDAAERGGWLLTRMPQKDIDQIKMGRAEYKALSPAAKRKKSLAFRKKWVTVNDSVRMAALRRRPKADEEQCSVPMIMDYYQRHPALCGFVKGHSGQHWSGRGAGEGYFWDDDDDS